MWQLIVDSGDSALLVEDSIESEIFLLSKDSSYMLVTSSHYASGSDADIYLAAANEEDLKDKLDYYSDSNNCCVY